jgi:ACS family tartrate transporter-like MFS transporter
MGSKKLGGCMASMEIVADGLPSAIADDEVVKRRAIRRASLRLVWFLILLYLLNNIDRTNVGFAALTMNAAIGLTAQTFGVAVGMFYVGYLLFEIPSNVVLAKTGARASLARMAIGSGLACASTAFIQTPTMFYIARFMLGVTEAGYLVGIVLYLSYWFPAEYRARLNALFMLSLPLAFTLSSAIAGSILSLDGWLGVAGWQWLFIIEGLPAVFAGIFTLFYLDNRPRDAAWLSEEEKTALENAVAREGHVTERKAAAMFKELPRLLSDPVVVVGGIIYFGLNFGIISLTSWMPSVVQTFGLSHHNVGFVTMIAPLTAAVAMIIWSRWSDLRQERVMNTAIAQFVGAAGWVLVALSKDPVWITAGFVIAAIGVYTTYAISFAITQTYVAPESRPVAIALVGVIGGIGGVFVPMIVGALRTASGNFTSGFLVVAAAMTVSAICTACLVPILRRRAQAAV